MVKFILPTFLLVSVLTSPVQYYFFAKWGHPSSQWVVCDVFGYDEVCK